VPKLSARILTALLGISAYEQPPANQASLDDPNVVALRERVGGQLTQLPTTQTRWYQADLEDAIFAADRGDMTIAARLWRSCKRDGVFMGVLSTRTGGLVRLPKKFRGRADIVEALQLGTGSDKKGKSKGAQGPRSVFDEMFPQAELTKLAADGIGLGVGLAELVPVKGRDYPVMIRREPEFLVYRWNENRWYYKTIAGLMLITPGDGRWLLHMPGGRIAPWQDGIWQAIGRAWISKEHAVMYRANWESKLANPARVAVSPQGASEDQEQSWFQQVMAWGVNTVFGLKNGYDVKLLESNGRGWECFGETIKDSEREYVIAVAGQEVTTDGGTGFSNADIHKSIRADLIKETADALAYTINTQGIPSWVVTRFGEEALEECALVEWEVTPAKDQNAAAMSLVSVANAITTLKAALGDGALDVSELCARFNVPVMGDADGDGQPDDGTEIGEDSVDVDFDDEDSDERDLSDEEIAFDEAA
jgi:hypothetical protein